jgi:signal transduction histidine kinase
MVLLLFEGEVDLTKVAARLPRRDPPWVSTSSSSGRALAVIHRRSGPGRPSVTDMHLRPVPRPTLIESVLALLLLGESAYELTGGTGGANPVVFVVIAVIPPLAVAFSRSAPAAAAAVLTACWLVDSFPGPAEGTLGAGFAMLAIVFGVSAWLDRPWPWVAAILLAGTIRDLRMVDSDTMDMAIDWGFVVVCCLAGRAVHHRTAQAHSLAGQLELTRSEQERRAAEAVAHERATIARELHDIVAHSVSLMVVQSGTARPLAERLEPELASVLATIESTGRGALDELRRLLAVLRADDDTELSPLPGIDAVPHLVERVRRAGLQVELRMDPVAAPAGIALCAYRVVQEGLTNALRHTRGGRTEVVLQAQAGGMEVRVTTTGGRATGQSDGTGTGLLGLRERVVLSGGQLQAGPGRDGWSLVATLPFEPRPVATARMESS